MSASTQVDTRRVYRVGARWHFVRPGSLRPGTTHVTECSSVPVRRLAASLAPPEVPIGDRCWSNGCRVLWPDTNPPMEGAHRG